MTFIDSLAQETNTAFTENGAVAHASTLDANLDFFSRAGAMRGRITEALALFERAYAEDPQLAMRNLFFMRDVRGGNGERDLFRKCIMSLSQEHRAKVIPMIAEYGRWDDLLSLPMTEVYSLIKKQLDQDIKKMRAGENISLLGKWCPSENTSSKVTQSRAIELIKLMGWSEEYYRKRLSELRAYLNILERKMSFKEWSEIDYSKLPSQAHRKHVAAFKRHDLERYAAYLESVKKGEAKVNTSTLYTYEVFDLLRKDEDLANAMWANLPDYTNGTNALVMADVSGSMSGRPMSVSVSLALYFAERNKGPFNGYFMTFTDKPRLVKVFGNDLRQKMNYIMKDVGYNTNIDAAFQAILDAAIRDKAKQEEMPSVLYVISDMAFDSSDIGGNGKSNFQYAREAFEEAGYKLPHLVFWNVNARDNSPATKFDNNVTLISGSSQSTFRYAVEGKTPLELMNDVLNSERYSRIVI